MNTLGKKKMDDAPDFIEVKGVKGRRFKSTRYYSGMENAFVLDVTYRFLLPEMHKAGAARYYALPEVGGDSGSPVMDEDGTVVGIQFAGSQKKNIHNVKEEKDTK